jgi:hypothetical protein
MWLEVAAAQASQMNRLPVGYQLKPKQEPKTVLELRRWRRVESSLLRIQHCERGSPSENEKVLPLESTSSTLRRVSEHDG